MTRTSRSSKPTAALFGTQANTVFDSASAGVMTLSRFLVIHIFLGGIRLARRNDFGELTKPFFWNGEGVLKLKPRISNPDQQRGSIMWAIIINMIYRQSCEKYLADLVRHRHSWI
jgi:hypothetical protein